MGINYEEEVKNATNASADVFKPTTGSYRISILEEPEPTEYVNEETKEKTAQWRIPIRVDGKEKKVWFVSIGKTLSSVQKQLALLGKSKGQLKGEEINLLVKHDGKKNEYTIIESVELQKIEQMKKDAKE